MDSGSIRENKHPRQFWIWVDGQKRYYDHPPEPPGHTVEGLIIMQTIKDYIQRRRGTER